MVRSANDETDGSSLTALNEWRRILMAQRDEGGSGSHPDRGHGDALKLDPLAFAGTAPYYARGRPPYSAALSDTLATELGLDGSGQLLDVGCGPGVLVLELAERFASTVALDSEPGMLAEGKRRADEAGLKDIRWVRGLAEDLGNFAIGPCRLVTFGQSFHRVHRQPVAELVYDLLEPAGAIALITHAVDGRPRPAGTGHPMIPHAEVQELIIRFLGEDTRTYLETWAKTPVERFEDSLARTRFGAARVVYAPGRPSVVRDIDSVVAGYFSMSYAAPPLFGVRRGESRKGGAPGAPCGPTGHSAAGVFWGLAGRHRDRAGAEGFRRLLI